MGDVEMRRDLREEGCRGRVHIIGIGTVPKPMAGERPIEKPPDRPSIRLNVGVEMGSHNRVTRPSSAAHYAGPPETAVAHRPYPECEMPSLNYWSCHLD